MLSISRPSGFLQIFPEFPIIQRRSEPSTFPKQEGNKHHQERHSKNQQFGLWTRRNLSFLFSTHWVGTGSSSQPQRRRDAEKLVSPAPRSKLLSGSTTRSRLWGEGGQSGRSREGRAAKGAVFLPCADPALSMFTPKTIPLNPDV